MFSIENLQEFLEGILNAELPEEEQLTNPFRLFADIGEAEKSYRNLNTVYAKRYGVISVLSSNVTPINGLQIYNGTVSVDILVNVDRVIGTLPDLGEYEEVKKIRRILDNVAANSSAVAHTYNDYGVMYSVVPVFTLSTAGTFEVQTSRLGKVIPLSFSVDVAVVQQGINSSSITLKINNKDVSVSQLAEDMVASSEGQTRMGRSKSTFNEQEAKYSLSFVTPLIDSDFCLEMINLMHNGNISGNIPVYSVSVVYPQPIGGFAHQMNVASVRLTGQIPNNAGLNIEMIEADSPYMPT